MIKLDIKQLDEALVLGLLSKEEATLYAKNKVDYDKTEYARSRFESLASATILSGLRRTIMSETLARTPGIESILKTDDTLGLYTNIEGIGGKLSDESTNNRTRWGSWVGEQLLIMYASGGIGNAVGNIPKLASVAERIGGVTAKIAIGSTARLEPWARGFGVGAGRTITEGIPFALSYSTLDGLAKEGFVNVDFTRRITEIIDQSNTKEGNTRIVLFLAVIKSISPFLRMIPSPTEWVSSIASKTLPGFSGRVAGGVKTAEAPSTLAVSADKISQALQNITLDTTTLLGADTVIRFERGEELPKRLEDIPNYVMQEVTAILPFAIGLRAMSKSMTHNPNEPIKIEIRANGDAVVKTGGETVVVPKELRQAAIAKDIAHLQKEIRGLKQSRDILRNEGDKHEAKEVSRTISGKKTEVKALKTEHAELSGNTPEGALAK